VSGRQLVNIAYQHLRPVNHASGCAEQCSGDCPMRRFSETLATPVLPTEIAEEKAREERFRAMAGQLNSVSHGQ
jgi:hypothetical protein